MKLTFKPLDLLQSIMKRWWIASFSMMVGGLSALILSQFIPPIYEASASFSVTIDYTSTGSLSDVQEDQAMRGIGYILTSDEVIDGVVDEVQLLKDDYSRNQFERDGTIDREEFQWTLRYLSSDPALAEEIARIWADTSNDVIQDGLVHAQIVESETELLWGLEDCLERSTGHFITKDMCGFTTTQDLLNEIGQASKSINEEKKQARGLFAPLAVQLVRQPQYPHSPIRHQKGLIVGAGILGGLILNVLIQGLILYRGSTFEE